MRLLSIDVGMKNLAYCLFEVNTKEDYKIIDWDVVNCCEERTKPSCGIIEGGEKCKFDAKFMKEVDEEDQEEGEKLVFYYCNKHAKNSEYKMPIPEMENKKLAKKSIFELKDFAECHFKDDYELASSGKWTKCKLLAFLDNIINKKYLNFIKTEMAVNTDLITIGRIMGNKFKNIFKDKIDIVIIENQISPLANRMKTLQGMITQYFIMEGVNIIEFISAANKLKLFMDKKDTTYGERKKMGIEITMKIIHGQKQFEEVRNKLDKSKKKDDLADSFLQGMWYLITTKQIEKIELEIK